MDFNALWATLVRQGIEVEPEDAAAIRCHLAPYTLDVSPMPARPGHRRTVEYLVSDAYGALVTAFVVIQA